MQTIPLTDREALASLISVGEKVEVTRKNGDIVSFRVEQISESAISGQGHAIPFDDIGQLMVVRSADSNGNMYRIWILLGLIAVLFVLFDTGVLEGQGY
jgi:hypothetical protein